jgi:CheY-like chemotaxis protein
MLGHEDLKWIAITSTELNSILQQVARDCDLTRRHKGEHNLIDSLGERVEHASKTTQALFDRVTSNILEETTKAAKPPMPLTPFTVPPSMRAVPVAGATGKVPTPVSSQLSPKVERNSVVRVTSTSNPSAAIPADILVKNARGNRELILLIEDEAEVAELAAEMLAEEGYKVIVTHNGLDALKNLRASRQTDRSGDSRFFPAGVGAKGRGSAPNQPQP